MKSMTALFVMTILTVCAAAPADVLAEWDLHGNSWNAKRIDVLSTHEDIEATAITHSKDLKLVKGKNLTEGVLAVQGWTQNRDEDKYFQWSVAVADGAAFAPESMQMTLSRGNYRGWCAESWDLVAYQGDQSFSLGTQSLAGSAPDMPTRVSYDLTTLTGLGGEIVFRLYGYDSQSKHDGTGFNASWSDDGINPVMYGAAGGGVVPEPATLTLTALGGAAMLARRRRRA